MLITALRNRLYGISDHLNRLYAETCVKIARWLISIARSRKTDADLILVPSRLYSDLLQLLEAAETRWQKESESLEQRLGQMEMTNER